MRHRLPLLVFCACAAFASVQPDAWAGPSRADIAEARKLVQQGDKAQKDQRWQEARDAYQKAIERNDTPNARLALAHAEEQLGHLIEALEQYRTVANQKGANLAQKKKAKDAITRVEPRIPKLTLSVPSGFAGTVRVDDMDVPASSLGTALQVNPGTRIVTARAEGFRPFEKSVVLPEGGSESVAIHLEPVPAAAPKPVAEIDSNTSSGRKTWGYVALATGGAGVVVGSIFGLSARKTRDDLRNDCTNDVCSEAQRDTYDKGKMQANISTVGFVVGGLGLGVGSYLLLTSPGKAEEGKAAVRLAPVVGVGQVGVEGSF